MPRPHPSQKQTVRPVRVPPGSKETFLGARTRVPSLKTTFRGREVEVRGGRRAEAAGGGAPRPAAPPARERRGVGACGQTDEGPQRGPRARPPVPRGVGKGARKFVGREKFRVTTSGAETREHPGKTRSLSAEGRGRLGGPGTGRRPSVRPCALTGTGRRCRYTRSRVRQARPGPVLTRAPSCCLRNSFHFRIHVEAERSALNTETLKKVGQL